MLETEIPKIEGADNYDQWYWHVVMPRNECLVTWPRSLTRAHEWDWTVLIPRRKPELDLTDLEAWSGAKRTGAKVMAGSRQYLFGAMGEMDRLTIRTTTLPLYVIVVGGTIFVLGVLYLYVRRKWIVFVVVAAGTFALVFLHPSYASIAGQVAVFGALLVTTTNLLAWLGRQSHRSHRPLHPLSSTPPVRLPRRGSSVVEQSTTLMSGSSQFRRSE